MVREYLQDKLNPLLISGIYFLCGGMWIFSTIFFFSEWFPEPEIFRRWEMIRCASWLLVTTGLIYLLIRHTETTLENSQESLHRVNRALKARSECSQILIRAVDEQELMAGICRIIVESEGYRLAWVGFAESDPDKTVRPVAQWGYENGYLETLQVSWGDNEHGRGPTGITIRSGKPSVAQHILTDPKWEPWREKALRYGYASSISLPLSDGNQVFGALVIFAGEPDAFDLQEVNLLQGLAEDLSYGITTLRMRRERERGRNEGMLLATIVEQEADGVLTFDTVGQIQYLNPAFEAISGFLREEIVGRNITNIGRNDQNQNFFGVMADSLHLGQTRTERFINRRNDGTLYDVEARIFPVSGPSGITAYAAVIRDLTHEVQLERQLCQAQKMEAIATLAGGISHDFNNILAAIITNTEMALDQVPEETALREHLAIVMKAGFRARNLVRQILTLSNQGEHERQPIRLELIVKECLKLLRASLPTTIDIPQHRPEGLGMVMADPTQVHQVLMNLCTNAADAMREKGGSLNIFLRNVDLPANDPVDDPHLPAGRYLRLTVADTGHGMDRKTMERIFDPFFTTKGPGRGTGLGLSVVHGIVKNHGGGITFTSERGKGTTFHVYLPRIDGAEEVREEDAAGPIPRGTERILFLDDEEDLVFSWQKMLETLGYRVVAGTNSVEALEVFRAQPDRFDLVITDQTMPHLTGERLAMEILGLRPDIPIILCTGLGSASGGGVTDRIARTIGIREVMRKPVERSEMARVIRRVLDDSP
jgi:PAS domain S-box-containing protein